MGKAYGTIGRTCWGGKLGTFGETIGHGWENLQGEPLGPCEETFRNDRETLQRVEWLENYWEILGNFCGKNDREGVGKLKTAIANVPSGSGNCSVVY